MPAPAVQNPNDGTALGTNEVISNEAIDPVQGSRVDPNMPGTQYKLPRSKIAVGAYGQDQGDASQAMPLPMRDYEQLRLAETERLRSTARGHAAFQRYAYEQITMIDARGGDISNRGSR